MECGLILRPHNQVEHGHFEDDGTRRTMTTPHSLYTKLQGVGSSPAIVYYGPGERIELSGKVAANHVAKIANYLADEVELIPGSRVVLDLPAHWKTIVWALGAMVAGGNVVIGRERIEDHEPDTVVVTNNPSGIKVDDGDTIVALNLASLAFSWDGDLDSDVHDGAAEVMSHPDTLLVSGLDTDSNASFYAKVLPDAPSDERVAIHLPGVLPLLATAYPVLADGHTLVVITDPDADCAKVCQDEGATLFADLPAPAPRS